MNKHIQITDGASDLLQKLETGGPVLRKLAGHAAARKTRSHFAARASSRHRSHMPFNYWANAARATSSQVQGDDVIISVDAVGVGLHLHGGTVRPRRGKYLAIPNTPVADQYGPKEFGDQLFFFRSKRTGTAGLAIKGQEKLSVMYWLKTSVTHQPDPTVIPSDQDYINAITPVVNDYLERLNGQ